MIVERWIIAGHVQGVGFRDWLVGIAQAEQVSGWCRNRENGTVEAVVGAARSTLDRLALACADGPPLAVVREIARTPWPGAAPPTPFARR